ncbi:MAG: acetyl xylan esterase, partial [Oscillospiraceae bacterium]|nr:acetyl xylan esterase [Oscillospiraceae bacterium]
IGGVWAGGDVMCSDLDDMGSGPAQGGVVDTPDGKWFSVVFQDRGAVGRVPVLVPVTWNKAGYPVFGKVTKEISNESTVSDAVCGALYSSDDFRSKSLKKVWQFNHEPHDGLWHTGGGRYTITTDKISPSLEYARNTLTQRTVLPGCTAEVTADASDIREGDTAGLCLLIGSYGLIGITKENGEYYLVMRAREKGSGDDAELARVPFAESKVRLSAKVRFEGGSGEVRFFYDMNGIWEPLGGAHKMSFTLDHFVGCRFGLYLYATKETGGSASFSGFEYTTER